MTTMLEKAEAIAPEITRLRRDIHAHPELSFEEHRTAALVADTLREIGIDVQEGIGRTGVVGNLGNGNGPTIAIRADMDALPIDEETAHDFVSTNQGVMHACGHDAHTAILLGVAHLLKQSMAEDEWRGNVRFLFQPSEEAYDENGISGATAMIADDAMSDVDAVISLHVNSEMPAGVCCFHDGPSLSSVDSFEATIHGTGGHGAYPHQGVDPVYILGQVLNAIYAIPSRLIDPIEPSVISIGHVGGGIAHNVIPDEVRLRGTIRSMSQTVRESLWQHLETALKISDLHGGSYELNILKGYPSLVNHKTVNNWMRDVGTELFGAENVSDEVFGMGAEDFSYMAQLANGAMFMLGAQIDDGHRRPHHTPVFDIDESVLHKGAAMLAETARRFVTGQIGF